MWMKKKESEKDLEDLISYYNKESSTYSSIVSIICRQLAFAQGAILWIFYSHLNISNFTLLWGFLFIVVFFLLDLTQYIVGKVKYEKIAKQFESNYDKKIKNKQHYIFPKNEIKPLTFFFYSKITVLIILSIMTIFQIGIHLYCSCN